MGDYGERYYGSYTPYIHTWPGQNRKRPNYRHGTARKLRAIAKRKKA